MNRIKDISNQPLIQWEGQVVITTAQLAEVYGSTTDNISDNFNRNKDRFTAGKHYILLEGKELRDFKNYSAESGLVSKNARQLYLWTRRGASRHCKILGTEKAWEQFDYLEEKYFDRQSNKQQVPLTLQQQIQTIAQGTSELYERVEALDKKIETTLLELPLLGVESDKINGALKKRGVEIAGGKDSNAYKDKRLLKRIYWDMHGQLRREFGVNTYKAIKRNQTELALKFLSEYKPPLILKNQIDQCNAQLSLQLEGGAAND